MSPQLNKQVGISYAFVIYFMGNMQELCTRADTHTHTLSLSHLSSLNPWQMQPRVK